jgi:hypothetical protein
VVGGGALAVAANCLNSTQTKKLTSRVGNGGLGDIQDVRDAVVSQVVEIIIMNKDGDEVDVRDLGPGENISFSIPVDATIQRKVLENKALLAREKSDPCTEKVELKCVVCCCCLLRSVWCGL